MDAEVTYSKVMDIFSGQGCSCTTNPGHSWEESTSAGSCTDGHGIIDHGVAQTDMIQVDILDQAAFRCTHHDATAGFNIDIDEVNTPYISGRTLRIDLAAIRMFWDIALVGSVGEAAMNFYGPVQYPTTHATSHNIGEATVFDITTSKGEQVNNPTGIFNSNIAKGAVQEILIGFITQTNCGTCGFQHTIGDSDMFTAATIDSRLQSDSVISGADKTIGYHSIMAAGEIDAIAIGPEEGVLNGDGMNDGPITIMKV